MTQRIQHAWDVTRNEALVEVSTETRIETYREVYWETIFEIYREVHWEEFGKVWLLLQNAIQ